LWGEDEDLFMESRVERLPVCPEYRAAPGRDHEVCWTQAGVPEDCTRPFFFHAIQWGGE